MAQKRAPQPVRADTVNALAERGDDALTRIHGQWRRMSPKERLSKVQQLKRGPEGNSTAWRMWTDYLSRTESAGPLKVQVQELVRTKRKLKQLPEPE